MKSFVFFVCLLYASSLWARSPRACQDIDQQKVLDKAQSIALVKKTAFYQSLLKIGNLEPSAQVHDCYHKAGQVEVRNIEVNIDGRRCLISSMRVNFEIQAGKVAFTPLQFQGKEIAFNTFVLNELEKSLEQLLKNSSARNSFEQAKVCNLEYFHDAADIAWYLKLKSSKGSWCFLKADLAGSKVSVIKRLYAKNSHCE